ncbi:MAG: nucleoside kinase [Candidatus Cloacimonadota bacterium]|nr:MAG: nucleoside kinase [Candidatus Cloacimonadota bacterium]
MFKIELKLDGEYVKTLAYAEPQTIASIVQGEESLPEGILIYKVDCQYLKSSTSIEADAKLDCVTINSSEGNAIYQDTAAFILCKAYFNLFSTRNKLVIEHSIGDGVFCEVLNYTFSSEDVENLSNEMMKIVQGAFPIEKISMDPKQVEKVVAKKNRDDVIKNLKYKNVDVYKCNGYYDYFLRQLADNTSVVKEFELVYHSPGFILRYPRKGQSRIDRKFTLPRNLFATHQEHDKWLNILNLHTVSALNRAIQDYSINELIQMEEALHEKKILDIANHISWKKDIKLVLIAGPSSSGKTSFAKRLSVQLRVNGIFPHIVSMDDYFLPRTETPRKKDGELDFESIRALDLELLNNDLETLLAGKEIELPKYNFVEGVRERSYKTLQLKENDILIMEGIHGLNDELTESVPFNQKVKIYVSALNNLNIDAHNRIPTTDSRKIRRMVRDHNFRGHSAEQTLMMWNSVRAGEDSNIFPYQENSDFMFNSILTYELAVLKKYAMPLLQSVNNYCPKYLEAQRLIRLLDHLYNIQDDVVPSNSILREFIGGSVFNY